MKTHSRLLIGLGTMFVLMGPASVKSAITTIVETGLTGEAPATIGASFGDDQPSYSDRAHQHQAAQFASATNLLSTTGDVIVPIPSYLAGKSYGLFANDARDNADYRALITAAEPSTFYLLVDNRVNGVARAAKANTNDPVLGGSLQWVIDGGWQRVHTAISPGGVSDYTAIDEGGNGDLQNFFAVFKFPSTTSQVAVSNNGFPGLNMVAVVAAPAAPATEPIDNFLAQFKTIQLGESSQLTWLISPTATAATIDQGVGSVLAMTDAGGGGGTPVSPIVDITYQLSVTTPTGSENATATVTVRRIKSFQADVTVVGPGEPVTLSWVIRPDAVPTISGIGDVSSQTVNGVGSIVVNPLVGTTYTLTATAQGISNTATVAVVMKRTGTQFALIDIGATGARAEPGSVSGAEIGAAANGVNATNLATTSLVADTGENFTIAMDNVDVNGVAMGGLDWRDRGDGPTQELVLLGEDFVKNNIGVIRVTLGGLPAGNYNIFSYHIDPQNSQCQNIRILVTDALGTGRDTGVLGNASFLGHPANTNAPQVAGLTTAIMDSKGASFQVSSDGTNNVIIYFDGSLDGVDRETPLAGIWIGKPPVTPAPGIRVVNVTRVVAGATASATIEFTSTPGKTYTISVSPDMANWSQTLSANWPASGDATTSFTETDIPLATARRFYRVKEN